MATMFEFGDGGFVDAVALAGAEPRPDTAWNDERTNEYRTGTWSVFIYLRGSGVTLLDRTGVTREVAAKRVADVRAAMAGRVTSSAEAPAPAPAKAAPAKKAAARTAKKS